MMLNGWRRVIGAEAMMPRAVAALLMLGCAGSVWAQAPLSMVDGSTRVRDISFKFVDSETFDEGRLKNRIGTTEPTFRDRLARIVPFMTPRRHLFDPIELQRDVVRLRRFYERNGFLHPTVDYPASQLDTTNNTIRVIFSITEGPPLIIQDVNFIDLEGRYVADIFTGDLRERWLRFRDQVTLEAGSRYTEFEGIRLQDRVLTWLKNVGFAFADVRQEAQVDSVANTVDVSFRVTPGPMTYIEEIEIEGNESVSDQIVRRELPLKEGDRFSARKLTDGQRRIFALNLFRVAIADVPEQPQDSLIFVRYRVREARLRTVSAQTGYDLDGGASVQADWRHRNFLGGARTLTLSGLIRSGIGGLSTPGGFERGSEQRMHATASLRQPYIFQRRLSGVFSPFYLQEKSPLHRLNFREIGMNNTLVYTIYDFRTVSLQHSFARAFPLGETELIIQPDLPVGDLQRVDAFNRSIFTLSGTFGRVNDFVNPRSGFLVRPLAEWAGPLVSAESDVRYSKLAADVSGYLPLNERFDLGGRLFLGGIWPVRSSRAQHEPQVEFRFDRIRFYAGGGSDVRGWRRNLLGPRRVAIDTLRTGEGTVRTDSLENPLVRQRFEPQGGLAKLAGNVELRMPFPGLRPAWRTAVFIDGGQVYGRECVRVENARCVESEGKPRIDLSDLRFSAGVGLRYETMIGFLRLDIAYKLNPSWEDFATTQEWLDVMEGRMSSDAVDRTLRGRIRIHLSIGQAF